MGRPRRFSAAGTAQTLPDGHFQQAETLADQHLPVDYQWVTDSVHVCRPVGDGHRPWAQAALWAAEPVPTAVLAQLHPQSAVHRFLFLCNACPLS